MNILYIISYYDIHDGASTALYSQYQLDRKTNNDTLVVCKWKGETQQDINIINISHKSVIFEFLQKENIFIHYYKAINSNILKKVLHYVKKNIPILMTVCQSPYVKPYLLSPYELLKCWHFVFIDKTSYHHQILDFVPINKKTQIYIIPCTYDNDLDNVPFADNSPFIIFGRGSTISKCPSDMFDVFDRIRLPNKKFVIVGIPESDNWVRREASKRKNVVVYPILDKHDWFKICASFDIFLYHLPAKSHASIDGNLGLAMSMRKPVVYMGSEAPKERFEHGINGFIANTVDEMAKYATELGKDAVLRKKIGNMARITTMRDFFGNKRELAYKKLYDELNNKPYDNIKIKIPFHYYLLYYKMCYKEVIKAFFNFYLTKPFGVTKLKDT